MTSLNKIKRIPWWGWLSGPFYFILQYSMYRLGNYCSFLIGTKESPWCPKIPAIDDLVPVVAAFIVIYVFAYVFWVCGPIAVSLTKKSNAINFFIGFTAAYIVGFLFFTFCPTYMDRTAEGLMDYAAGGGLFDGALAWIYSIDGSEIAFNLFPSYHCLISVYCYLGVRGQEEISKGYRTYSLIMAILICLSTQFTKQHYILDLIGGVAVAVICYVIVEKINPGERILAKKSR